MERLNKILVFSHVEFDQYCYENKWDDDNVDELNNHAFISIIGTKECQKYYLEEDEYHWFKENHNNVLNLEFDDIEHDIDYNGHLFKALNEKDAEKLVDFIDNNIGKHFIIHCRAGRSRSQAIFKYITTMYYKLYDEETCGRKDNPCFSPNMHVVSLLKRTYYKKYGLFVNEENNDF